MSAVFNIAAGQQANALGKFNQSFEKFQGTTKVNVLKSGATLSGTALKILQSNAEQAELQRDVIDYNSQVAQSQKMEEANFARIQGQIARRQGKIAQLGYYAKAGESLLSMQQEGMFG